MTEKKSVVLAILDGWGIGDGGSNDATAMADTPIMDRLLDEFSNTSIGAHGLAVGLPADQMGNSEVGHLNLGAGRVVKQNLVLIDDAVADGSFATNPTCVDAIKKIKDAGGRAHIIGLCSPGGVHSSLNHLYALVEMMSAAGLQIFLHALTDGRDTPPSSAREYLRDIETKIAGKARVSTVVGRFYSMDRDKRWDRVERGYMAHVAGEGTAHLNVDEAIAAAYEAGETDEFITPRIIVDEAGAPVGAMKDSDGVFFFNFRADRAREMTSALALDNFEGFERKVRPTLSAFVSMTEYHADFGLPTAFEPTQLDQILGQVLCEKGLRQFRCAETEKYAHVTFFFNGGLEEPFENEDRKLVPSPKEVATYDLKPQMSAEAVGDFTVEAINSRQYDFVIVNFANPDMVGHTGIMEAAINAAKVVDTQVGRLVQAVKKTGGSMLITADHGNLEKMVDPYTGKPHTAHTNNPVPLILVDESMKNIKLESGGKLCDVAPTLLKLMKLQPPAQMTGRCLICD